MVFLVVSIVIQRLIKRSIFRIIRRIFHKKSPIILQELESEGVLKYSSKLVPIIILYVGFQFGLKFISNTNSFLINISLNIIIIWLVLALFQWLNSVLSLIINQITRTHIINKILIRTAHQVIKILLVGCFIVVAIGILLNKSPLIILSSLGALTAILLLVFKDSILGFVASIQVSLLGIVRVGDWVEMPAYNADGNILDITISSIKVQNFDKTITTIPTYAIISQPVKNWRGMEESNCRRIKRSIHIDINTIEFCEKKWLTQLKKIDCLSQFIEGYEARLANNDPINDENTNHQPLTNVGVFRAYLNYYLSNHPNINQSTTLLVRQLQSSDVGLPIELYCFTNTTNWVKYEAIQSDIFDHILSIISSFKLKVFQQPLFIK